MGQKSGFKKDLSMLGLICMAAGGMVGAWMVEIKYWFELSGAMSCVALLVCALFILPLTLIYTELTSAMPYAGGINIWASNAFGWNMGFAGYWIVQFLYLIAMPSVAYGISTMLSYWFDLSWYMTKLIALVIMAAAFVLSNKEIKLMATIQNILFWGTLVVSVGASVIFIFSGSWSFETMKPLFPTGGAGFMLAVSTLLYKFVGFEMIPNLVEDTNFERKNLWKAFFGAIGATLLIYGLAAFGVGGIFTREMVMNADVVDPSVADSIGMHWLALAIIVMGIGTCITTVPGFWLSAARAMYGASTQRQLPEFFGKLNKNGQPANANVVIGILSLLLTVAAPEEWINYLYNLCGLFAGLNYGLATICFLVLRHKKPEWKRPYRVKCLPLVAGVSLLFVCYVLYNCIVGMTVSTIVVFVGYSLLGVVMWGYAKRKQKTDPEEWAPRIISPDTEPIE